MNLKIKPLFMYNLSKDYDLLFSFLKLGNQPVCYVNYSYRNHDNEKPYRDICRVRRLRENSISFAARGIEYGGVNEWDLDNKRTEIDLFISECIRLDVEFILP